MHTRDHDTICIPVFGPDYRLASIGLVRDRSLVLVLGASDIEKREEGHTQGIAETLCDWNYALPIVLSPM